jgi:hypothetical protein
VSAREKNCVALAKPAVNSCQQSSAATYVQSGNTLVKRPSADIGGSEEERERHIGAGVATLAEPLRLQVLEELFDWERPSLSDQLKQRVGQIGGGHINTGLRHVAVCAFLPSYQDAGNFAMTSPAG